MENKKDLRVIKTKKALYNTLLELMKDKTFEEIKISDICTNALINRSTFYSHYNDKYELLIDFINSLKESLISDLEKNENSLNTKEFFMEMINIYLNHLEEKKNIYYAILINNRNSIMMDILLDVANNDIKKRIEKLDINKLENVPNDIVTKFYLGAVVSIIVEWLRSNSKYTKENIIDYLETLIPDEINK